MMDKLTSWVEAKLVPITNKITSLYWFSIIANAVLFIVPFSMANAVSALWGVLRKFFPSLIDLSPIGNFSFGLTGLFMVFLIAHDTMVKEERRDRSCIAGFTAIGTYMLCMHTTVVDEGTAFTFTQFGAAGLFTAMVIGVVVGAIFKKMAHFSFFGEDSMMPDMVLVNFILAAIIYYPFFIVADRYELKKEQEREAAKQAKRAAQQAQQA